MVGVAVHDAVGVVSPGLVLHRLGEPLALGVGMVPEVQEEQQEDEPVEANDVDEDRELIGAVLQKEILADMCGYHHKLDLQRGGGRGVERGRDVSKSFLNKDPSKTAEPMLPHSVPAGWTSGTSSTRGTSGSWGPRQSGRSKCT